MSTDHPSTRNLIQTLWSYVLGYSGAPEALAACDSYLEAVSLSEMEDWLCQITSYLRLFVHDGAGQETELRETVKAILLSAAPAPPKPAVPSGGHGVLVEPRPTEELLAELEQEYKRTFGHTWAEERAKRRADTLAQRRAAFLVCWEYLQQCRPDLEGRAVGRIVPDTSGGSVRRIAYVLQGYDLAVALLADQAGIT